jgi:hypothetical protein
MYSTSSSWNRRSKSSSASGGITTSRCHGCADHFGPGRACIQSSRNDQLPFVVQSVQLILLTPHHTARPRGQGAGQESIETPAPPPSLCRVELEFEA